MDALRGQLEGAERAAVPPWVAHVVGWFWALAHQRAGNGYGPNPISWQEIRAWSEVTGIRPEPWEIDALTSMDSAWGAHYAKAKGLTPDAPGGPLPELSGDALDRMLGM